MSKKEEVKWYCNDCFITSIIWFLHPPKVWLFISQTFNQDLFLATSYCEGVQWILPELVQRLQPITHATLLSLKKAKCFGDGFHGTGHQGATVIWVQWCALWKDCFCLSLLGCQNDNCVETVWTNEVRADAQQEVCKLPRRHGSAIQHKIRFQRSAMLKKC